MLQYFYWQILSTWKVNLSGCGTCIYQFIIIINFIITIIIIIINIIITNIIIIIMIFFYFLIRYIKSQWSILSNLVLLKSKGVKMIL